MATCCDGKSFDVNAKVREDYYALKPRRIEDIRRGESPCTEDLSCGKRIEGSVPLEIMATRSWELICDEAIMR